MDVAQDSPSKSSGGRGDVVAHNATVVADVSALGLQLGFASSTGEALGRTATLIDNSDAIRVHYEELEPGRRSSRAHYHTHREECLYVISGEVELEVGDETLRLGAGAFVSLPAGPPSQCVWNRGANAAQLLVFSATPRPD